MAEPFCMNRSCGADAVAADSPLMMLVNPKSMKLMPEGMLTSPAGLPGQNDPPHSLKT